MDEKVQEAAAKAAEEVVEKFEKEWEPMMDAIEESVETFGNIDGERQTGLAVDLSCSTLIGKGIKRLGLDHVA